MNGSEIITMLNNNLEVVTSAVSSVTGGLITAIFLRHNTAAKEFEKIKAGQFKEVIDLLLESGKMTYTEYYKANNFLQVAKKADKYYSQIHHDDTGRIYDFDWFVRFFEASGNVSDKTMQELWAKILSGEIAQPSTYSLRTIDILKNISKTDAELFIKVCSHSFCSGAKRVFLPNNDKYLEKVGISYNEIMKLSELGIMFNDGTIEMSIPITTMPTVVFVNKDLIMNISSDKGDDTVRLSQYPFTESGSELASIISQTPSDDDFIEYGRQLASEYGNFNVSVHKIQYWNGNDVKFSKENLIEE